MRCGVLCCGGFGGASPIHELERVVLWHGECGNSGKNSVFKTPQFTYPIANPFEQPTL